VLIFGLGSAPDPAVRACDVTPDLIVGWGVDTSSPYLSPSTPSVSRSRRLGGRCPPQPKSWRRRWIDTADNMAYLVHWIISTMK